MGDKDLMLLRAALDAEMRQRNLAFSVGAVGEQLAISHFNMTAGLPKLQKAPVGTKNVDALSRNGDRYSIKAVCVGKKTGTVYPDSQERDRQLFEYMLVVQLTETWDLKSIHQLSWETFQHARSWDKRMNAWYLSISKRALGDATKIM